MNSDIIKNEIQIEIYIKKESEFKQAKEKNLKI